MKKLLLNALIFVITLNLLSLSPAVAEGDPLLAQCNHAFSLCQEALEATEAESKGKDELIDSQEELIKKLATQRNEAYDQLGEEKGTGWDNPTFVALTFILGFTLGALVVKEVR